MHNNVEYTDHVKRYSHLSALRSYIDFSFTIGLLPCYDSHIGTSGAVGSMRYSAHPRSDFLSSKSVQKAMDTISGIGLYYVIYYVTFAVGDSDTLTVGDSEISISKQRQ